MHLIVRSCQVLFSHLGNTSSGHVDHTSSAPVTDCFCNGTFDSELLPLTPSVLGHISTTSFECDETTSLTLGRVYEGQNINK